MNSVGAVFNKENIYAESIKETAEKLSLLCRQNNMPFFWTICTGNGEDGTTYESDGASAASRGMNVMDDRVPKHLAVAMGFNVAKPTEEFDSGYLDYSIPDESQMPYPDFDI